MARTRKTRKKLVVPEKGFSAPIKVWHGEACPNRQNFNAVDQEYNYLTTKLSWLQHEITLVKPTVEAMGKLTREERIAQLAETKAIDGVVAASAKLDEKLGTDDIGKAKKAWALFKAGDYDDEMMAIKFRKGSAEFKAALTKLGYKVK